MSTQFLLLLSAFTTCRAFLLNTRSNYEPFHEELYQVTSPYMAEPSSSIGDMRILHDPYFPRSIGYKLTSKVWPDNTVYFRFDSGMNKRSRILRAIHDFHRYTCLRFLPATPGVKDYILLTNKDDGCFADLGYQARGTRGKEPQKINLGPGCTSTGLIKHELMHAIGFAHEHQRQDRDDYVTIKKENIKKKQLHNFEKLQLDNYSHWKTPYDFQSIMHYPLTAFAKKKGLKTMVLRGNKSVKVGKAKYFSINDLAAINRMYKC